jgi:hypothetical protein
MGTRSTYRIIEEWKDDTTGKISQSKLVLMYVQYDGYPTGHPMDTAKWLASGKVVNGYGANEKKLVFNGAGCLAAQLVAKFKDGVGGCYIQSLDSRGESWEDYLYDIIVKEDKTIEYVCYDNVDDKPELFRGTPADFVKKFKKEEVEA